MNTPNRKKPLLEAVVDILDLSLILLKKYPNAAEKDGITDAIKEIENVKNQIKNYEKEKANKILYETINWGEDKEKVNTLFSWLTNYFR